jgi:hypothetical protein
MQSKRDEDLDMPWYDVFVEWDLSFLHLQDQHKGDKLPDKL